MSTWTKISAAVDILDDDAISGVALKTDITNPDTDEDVDAGDLLIEYMGNGRRMYTYAEPITPDYSVVNRGEFNRRRANLITQYECLYARDRIMADNAASVETPQKYHDRAVYMNDLLDLPETQTNFDTVIASVEFDIDTDIDWPTPPE